MNSLFFDLSWLVGGVLAGIVLHKGFHAGWFTVKPAPPTVRISPELLSQMRDELIFNASKRVVAFGRRPVRAGQSRRPLP